MTIYFIKFQYTAYISNNLSIVHYYYQNMLLSFLSMSQSNPSVLSIFHNIPYSIILYYIFSLFTTHFYADSCAIMCSHTLTLLAAKHHPNSKKMPERLITFRHLLYNSILRYSSSPSQESMISLHFYSFCKKVLRTISARI